MPAHVMRASGLQLQKNKNQFKYDYGYTVSLTV